MKRRSTIHDLEQSNNTEDKLSDNLNSSGEQNWKLLYLWAKGITV